MTNITSLQLILLLLIIFLAGVLAGYVWHIVRLNRRILKHGMKPQEFFRKIQ